MNIVTKAFIPLRDQGTKLAEIAWKDHAYLEVINQHIQNFKPLLCFDWEREISNALIAEQDEFLAAVEAGIVEQRSVGELQSIVFPDAINRFKSQRLIRFQPERIMIVNNIVGVECLYDGQPEDDFFIPSSVQVTSHVYPLSEMDKYRGQESYQAMLAVACVYAFIADPFTA